MLSLICNLVQVWFISFFVFTAIGAEGTEYTIAFLVISLTTYFYIVTVTIYLCISTKQGPGRHYRDGKWFEKPLIEEEKKEEVDGENN